MKRPPGSVAWGLPKRDKEICQNQIEVPPSPRSLFLGLHRGSGAPPEDPTSGEKQVEWECQRVEKGERQTSATSESSFAITFAQSAS